MDLSERKREVLERLKRDLVAADFQCSLLAAAICSYRHSTVLKPFPPMYAKEGENDQHDNGFKDLEKAYAKLPSLKQLQGHGVDSLDTNLLQLLHWSLLPKHYSVKTVEKSKFSAIQKLTKQSIQVAVPNYIFEVSYSSPSNDKFEELSQERELMYAYHGSRVENFHSILNHGLHSHMNKNSLFGEGTYLSSELSVVMPYCPTGKAWEKSLMGEKLSCIAVCQIIDHPSVKCQVKNGQNGSTVRSRAHAQGSQGGEVPEKYYVVQNNEVLRLKYVLVYADTSKSKRSIRQSWFYRHRFIVMMFMYVFLLVAIGLANSKTFWYYMRRYWR